MTSIPDDLHYLEHHHWIRAVGPKRFRMGVTDFAQESLGDVIAVDLPEVGSTIEAGDPIGEIESTKSVSDLFAPISGTVTAINGDAAAQPDLTNTDPYGDGWLIEMAADPAVVAAQLDVLLDPPAYRHLTGNG